MREPLSQVTAVRNFFCFRILFDFFLYFYCKNQFGSALAAFARNLDPNKMTANLIKVMGKTQKYTNPKAPRMKSDTFGSVGPTPIIKKT